MTGWPIAIVGLLAVGVLASAGRAAAPEPRLMVFYVEAPPAKAAAVARALQAQAEDDRKAGAAAAEALAESGRPGRMALVEQWRDLPVAEAARRAKALDSRLAPDLQAPVDDRPNDPLLPLDLKPAPAGAFHVLMHIDVIPDGAAVARQALTAQKAEVLAAPGALAFQAASQTGRPNHFAVHEAWSSRAAYEAYAASPAAQDLRRRLTPFKGAPFDDRLYALNEAAGR
jgi:quinol monooxygenase YgiN